MRTSIVLAAAASLSTASAALQGFNYGSTKTDGSFMYEADFKSKFTTAQNLVGTSGFSSARLYTMIQGGSSTNEPTQAIQAAIDTKTSLLLGLWGSGGDGFLQAEITALKSAITQYGDDFTSLVVGISVGSEDLYRVSPTGIAAKSGYGAEPDTLVGYISQVRSAIAGTSLSGAKVGHVDTWTAWVNGSNSAVWDACDFVGMDAYPYFQDTMTNDIGTGKGLFNDALAATKGSTGKDVWITETGWPVSGPVSGNAVASIANAKTYWDEVACPLLGNVNTWWFTLQDADPTVPSPSFGIVGSTLSTTPLFDLSCSAVSSSSSSSASSGSSSTSAVASSSTASSGSGSESGSSSQSKASSVTASSESSAASGYVSSVTSAAASLSSGASSLSSAASATDIASSGGGLSPSQGVGIGSSGSGTTAGSGAAPTGLTGLNGTSVVTGSTPTPTSSTAASSTSVITVGNNAARGSVSIVAAFAAILVAAAVL